MPIVTGRDASGSHYFNWGNTGKKYYFDPSSALSKASALRKAQAQQTAIYASGYKGDEQYGNLKNAEYTVAHLQRATIGAIDNAILSFNAFINLFSELIKTSPDDNKLKRDLADYKNKVSKLKNEKSSRESKPRIIAKPYVRQQNHDPDDNWNCCQYIQSKEKPCPICGKRFKDK